MGCQFAVSLQTYAINLIERFDWLEEQLKGSKGLKKKIILREMEKSDHARELLMNWYLALNVSERCRTDRTRIHAENSRAILFAYLNRLKPKLPLCVGDERDDHVWKCNYCFKRYENSHERKTELPARLEMKDELEIIEGISKMSIRADKPNLLKRSL